MRPRPSAETAANLEMMQREMLLDAARLRAEREAAKLARREEKRKAAAERRKAKKA